MWENLEVLRLLCLFLWVLALGGNVSVEAESWSRFRGPNGSGLSRDKGFPTVFGKDKNVAWRVHVRSGKSSPVLTRRLVYLTASDTRKLYTQCFDRKTGKLLWERSIDQPRTELATGLNHAAAITPVIDGDENVYAFFKDFGLVSYDSAGKLRWKRPLGPFVTTQGLGASPVLVGDAVVLVVDQWENSYIAAFDRGNGAIRWKVPRHEAEGWATPLLYVTAEMMPQVVTVSRGEFGMHRVSDGQRTATLGGLAASIVASPVLDGHTVYALGYGGDAPIRFSQRLKLFDKNKDGRLSPDEYGNDSILSNLANNVGNRDGTVSEDKWDVFAKGILGPNRLIAIGVLSLLVLKWSAPRALAFR